MSEKDLSYQAMKELNFYLISMNVKGDQASEMIIDLA